MKNKLSVSLSLVVLILIVLISVESKKISKSRSSSSSRGSSKTNYNPSPTSLSYPQPAPAPKPSLFGWQEKSAQRTQTQSKPTGSQSHSYPSSNSQSHSYPSSSGQSHSYPSSNGQSHSYPSSNGQSHSYPSSNGQSHSYPSSNSQSHSYPSGQTGLSGNSQANKPHQDNVQRNNAAQNTAGRQSPQPNNQPGHSYPSSGGLSGNSGAGVGNRPQQGLSGSGVAASGGGQPNYPNNNNFGNQHPQGAPPPYSGSASGVGYPKQQPPPYSGGNYPNNNYGNHYHHPQGPPPPYGSGYGGHHGSNYNPAYTPQMPGYFGNYGGSNYGRGFGGMSRGRSALTGVGIAGAGIGTILTGLALWNLARSTGRQHHTVIYDNRGQPVAVAPNNSTEPVVDPILGDLVNCTLTIANDNSTEVLAIPCAIATSFTPDADVKDTSSNINPNDNTKCTVTVVTKEGKEFMTTIACSMLLNSAAENNVTEPPLLPNNGTDVSETTISPDDKSNSNQPTAHRFSSEPDVSNLKLNCTYEQGDLRDPINPCFSVSHNLTVIPLEVNNTTPVTPVIA